MSEALLDYSELSRFCNRALNKMISESDKYSKQTVRKIGQRAVKLTKTAMKRQGISTKSALYRAVKKTGVWGHHNDNWAIRTYFSSSVLNKDGQSGRGHAWFVEHGHKTRTKTGYGQPVEGKHYEGEAIPEMQENFTEILEDQIDKMLAEGFALGI